MSTDARLRLPVGTAGWGRAGIPFYRSRTARLGETCLVKGPRRRSNEASRRDFGAMPKHQASPSREQRQAAKDKRAKRAEARERARKRDRVSSSSSEGEGEPTRQSQQPRGPGGRFAPAPAPAGAPAPAPAAAPAPAPARPVIVPQEYSPSELNANWLVSAGRDDEARLVVHPFKDHPAPPLNAPWARCGFAEGWEPGWGWNAIPAWLRVRLEHQGFDPTNPANVRQLEKECAICKKYNLRPHMPLSMLTPTGFETSLVRRAEVATDPARAAQLRKAQRKLHSLRSRCEQAAYPGAEAEAALGCCELCAWHVEFVLRVLGEDYEERGFVRGRLVDGEVVLENVAPHDATLINDHLEWSATHRMWARRTASSVCSPLTCST